MAVLKITREIKIVCVTDNYTVNRTYIDLDFRSMNRKWLTGELFANVWWVPFRVNTTTGNNAT